MSARLSLVAYRSVFGDTPVPAATLGFAGLLPFVVLAVLAIALPEARVAWVERLLVGYAAIILSFMGGCRWGFAAAGLGDGPTHRQFTFAVAPALYAWVAGQLDFELAALALAVGFVALYVADRALARGLGAPAWWPVLRLPLTAGATLALVVPASS